MPEAWVNWNPNPDVHAFGADMGARVVALCRVTVRERRGTFDPDDPKACEFCARAVREGWSFEEAQNHRPAIDLSRAIVCRRPS